MAPQNIVDPFITLAEETLELLCRDCHGVKYIGDLPTVTDLMFASTGNLIKRIAEL